MSQEISKTLGIIDSKGLDPLESSQALNFEEI